MLSDLIDSSYMDDIDMDNPDLEKQMSELFSDVTGSKSKTAGVKKNKPAAAGADKKGLAASKVSETNVTTHCPEHGQGLTPEPVNPIEFYGARLHALIEAIDEHLTMLEYMESVERIGRYAREISSIARMMKGLE